MKVITGVQRSRRLGRSLGVNLFKLKTCNLDCIYCEYGENSIYKEQQSFSLDEIIYELDQARKTYVDFDYITLSGLGEPTIHPDFNKVVDYLYQHFDAKICVITNTTTIDSKDIQESLQKVDVIMPSLDAISMCTFKKINRPDSNINYDNILKALKQFCSTYRGQVFVELFFSEGINDNEDELILMAEYLNDLNYTRVDINSLDRAGAIDGLRKISETKRFFIKEFLEARGVKNINIV
jgi:wyosine [tRNA(Phe)-imidazoG37] synthetase (radical SAM superfamily)